MIQRYCQISPHLIAMKKNKGALVHRSYGENQFLEIRESDNRRSLYFGSGYLQGQMSLSAPHELVVSYTRYMLMALLVSSWPKKILMIGIGPGSFVRFFQHHFPLCQIDAVDSSQNVINAATKFFFLNTNRRVSIFCADGHHFLKNNQHNQYDIVLIDAFDDHGMAPTIYNESCLALVAKSLTPDGVVSCNLWSSEETQLQKIKAVLANHFQSNIYLPVPDRANIVALAMPRKIPWSRIFRDKRELNTLTRCYNINFQKIIHVAKQNNYTISKRLLAIFAALIV